jgi:hypothetical protein
MLFRIGLLLILVHISTIDAGLGKKSLVEVLSFIQIEIFRQEMRKERRIQRWYVRWYLWGPQFDVQSKKSFRMFLQGRLRKER